MRRALLAALFAALAIPAQADTIRVVLDDVQIITFPRPVGTVNVGNPSIADITMVSPLRAFIQGKSYGSTNIIALGKDGNPISNPLVNVLPRPQDTTVTLNRGTQRTTYNCTPRCEVVPQPGDGKDAFTNALGQSMAHQQAATNAANGASPTAN